MEFLGQETTRRRILIRGPAGLQALA